MSESKLENFNDGIEKQLAQMNRSLGSAGKEVKRSIGIFGRIKAIFDAIFNWTRHP